MLFSKSDVIKELAMEHMQAVKHCLIACEHAVMEVIEGCEAEALCNLVDNLSELESEADAVRHKIIRELLDGGLLVDSRKSLMRVMESVDDIADISEDIMQEFKVQKLILPSSSHKSVVEMMAMTQAQYDILIEVISGILSKYKTKEIKSRILEIEGLESRVDQIQRKVIELIFESDETLAYKRQVREQINLIGSISDLIEDISDEIEIIMLARKV